MPKQELDAIDVRIIRELQLDARLTNVELSRRVGLSPTPCLRRVNRLEAEGIIKSYTALVDERAVGRPISVFVSVSLERQVEATLESFEALIKDLPEVLECYLMTGNSDYLLRVVTSDLASFETFLKQHLTLIPGVANIRSSFSLKQVVHRTVLPN